MEERAKMSPWRKMAEELRGDSPKLSRGGLERETTTLSMDAWTKEEMESPFQGLPPLPEVFKAGQLSQNSQPGKVEEAKPLETKHRTLQEKISWLQREMLCLRRYDMALFNQLYILALEIQDLSEFSQEMETFYKEQLASESQPRDARRSRSAVGFELTF